MLVTLMQQPVEGSALAQVRLLVGGSQQRGGATAVIGTLCMPVQNKQQHCGLPSLRWLASFQGTP